jgi:hypothetical protein
MRRLMDTVRAQQPQRSFNKLERVIQVTPGGEVPYYLEWPFLSLVSIREIRGKGNDAKMGDRVLVSSKRGELYLEAFRAGHAVTMSTLQTKFRLCQLYVDSTITITGLPAEV